MELSGPVRIEIAALVFDGVTPRDRAAVARAAEFELGRLFEERGVPAMLSVAGEHGTLRGTPLARAGAGASLGAQVAHSVYGALGS